MRDKLLITNKSYLSVRLIDLNHSNHILTIISIHNGPLINLEQKRKE